MKKRLTVTTPKHLHDGFVPVTRDDVTDLALLPKRFDLFAADVRQSFEILSGKVLPLLAELRDLVKQHGDRLAYLERSKAAVSETLLQHENHHEIHRESITGLHRRVTVIEQSILKRKGKSK